MKKVFAFMFLVVCHYATAQVGVGTQNPQGIFNVDGGKDNAATGAPTVTQQANDFIVLSSGNVGIGTTSPSTKLDVNGVIKGRYGNLLEDQFGPILQNIYGLGGGNNDYLSISPTGTSSNLGIIFKTSNIDQASLVERVRINPNGNVGIGLIPNAKLDVLSASKEVARFVTTLSTTDFAHIAIGNQSGAWAKLASGSGAFAIRNYSDDSTILHADLVTGNVGIKESNPTFTLDVNGTSRLVNTPLISNATKVLVKNPSTGQISEQSIASPSALSVVYVNAATPATATIFDTANPPATNNNALKNLTTAIYIGTNGSQWTSNGTTYSSYAPSFQAASDEFTATAGQTTFTLTGLALGKVSFFRNGSRLTNACFSVVGTRVTYVPANNGGASLGTLVAGDTITIDYVK